MRVNEIFQSIEGEGKRAGSLATFIRLCGCNLRCAYCDTKYAFDLESGKEMSPEEIVAEVQWISIGRYVTVTGGEPLIHKDVDSLIHLLVREGFQVNIETNGTVVPRAEWEPLNARWNKQLFYTMDYKTGSSGESSKMSLTAIRALTEHDVLKFVVGSEADMDEAVQVIKQTNTEAQVYFSPVFGALEPKDIVAYMQRKKLDNVKIQLQLHKYIWDPNMRGV